MKSLHLSILLFILPVFLTAQNTTISGFIRDADTGETLIGANVFDPASSVGTTTNEYGFYSITLPKGTYTLQFSYLGYETVARNVDLSDNITLNIEIAPESTELSEVIISSRAEDSNVSDNEMSVNRMDMSTIQKMPSLLGEVEILRSILLLPGVTSVGEGASGFNVRGGSIDQNLVLLDEAPVYNSSHLFGFFSVFNPDAVKDVKLYKGGIPSRYGGRLSSILDVRMKEGNRKNLSLQGGIGAIFSRLSVEAPIVPDKSSFIVAARRSYIDVLAKPFLQDDLDDTALNFYDLTIKTNYEISDKDRLFLSGYLGRDNFRFGDDAGFNWGNATATFRWNHLFSQRLFSNLTTFYSNYDYQIHFGAESDNKFDWDARIKTYSVKPEFSWFITPENQVRFGGQLISYTFEPANAVGVSQGESLDLSLDEKYAVEGGVFIENEQKISSRLDAHYGLRLSYFDYRGKGRAYTYGTSELGSRRPVIDIQEYGDGESIKSYINWEPRLSLKYQLSDDNSVKFSFNRMSQYIHLISNTAAATPVDIWTPSTNTTEPQMADQYALGYFQNLQQNTYELSVEIYYKKMNHLVDYIDNADILLNEFLEGDLLEGDGRAYGLELLAKKNKGRLSGWLSYTLSRTERIVDGINNNEWYPSRFDQTHNLSLAAFYDLNKRITFSANFTYLSGTPLTVASVGIEQQQLIIPIEPSNQRNNFRIPSYHRLDLSATIKNKKNETRRWQGEWVFSIYNVYSRRNAFSIYTRQTEAQNAEAIRLSVVGNFIPSVSYNFKF